MSYVVLSINTTSLNLAQAVLTEIAAVKVRPSGEIQTFHTLVKPTDPSAATAFADLGITEKQIARESSDLRDALGKLLLFIGDDPIIAHHGFGFDFPVIANAFSRSGIPVPTNPILDTEVLSRETLQFEDYQSLSGVCLTQGNSNSLPQRALVKARATAEIVELILSQNRDLQGLWEKTSGYLWSDLQKLPPPFDLLKMLIDFGLDAEVEHREENQSPILRWITPLQVIISGPSKLALVAYCHLDECEKKFPLDHIRDVVQTGVFKVDGEIRWTVTKASVDGQGITELRFEKQHRGEHAGEFHPMFYMMPMIFLSNFIEPTYKLWRAYLGDELIGSNLVYENGRVLSYEEGRKAVDDFSDT